MEKFTVLSGIAAPIELSNVDTDMIIPKQFLKTIKREGLSKGLFYEMRFDNEANLIDSFILNKKPFDNSKILVSYNNFGCGSSREHAPWALLDFGIKAIIAKSFADIFYNNCFKNGILPIKLDGNQIEKIINQIKSGEVSLEVDLLKQKISGTNFNFSFEIDSYKKNCLINGWDDIDLTLKDIDFIAKYEIENLQNWLVPEHSYE